MQHNERGLSMRLRAKLHVIIFLTSSLDTCSQTLWEHHSRVCEAPIWIQATACEDRGGFHLHHLSNLKQYQGTICPAGEITWIDTVHIIFPKGANSDSLQPFSVRKIAQGKTPFYLHAIAFIQIGSTYPRIVSPAWNLQDNAWSCRHWDQGGHEKNIMCR